MGCPHCGEERPLLLEMCPKSPTGRWYKCTSCGFSSATKPGSEPAPVVAAEPVSVAGVSGAGSGLKKQEPKQPRKRRAAPDVGKTIREARAELKAVRRDRKACERELKALQKAEDQLQKLLDAADGKSLAVVRQLRQSRN